MKHGEWMSEAIGDLSAVDPGDYFENLDLCAECQRELMHKMAEIMAENNMRVDEDGEETIAEMPLEEHIGVALSMGMMMGHYMARRQAAEKEE